MTLTKYTRSESRRHIYGEGEREFCDRLQTPTEDELFYSPLCVSE